jgi:hypothetical protein
MTNNQKLFLTGIILGLILASYHYADSIYSNTLKLIGKILGYSAIVVLLFIAIYLIIDVIDVIIKIDKKPCAKK